MNSQPSKDLNYLPYLDGLRAIAALYVVMHHIFLQFAFDYTNLNRIETGITSVFMYGHYAVNFFIVLSGFCLTIPLIKANKFQLGSGIPIFYGKRIRRIVIPYFFALAFSLILIKTLIGKTTGTHWDVSLPVSIKDIATHLLLIQDLFSSTTAKINHAMWSISVECRIYVLFPLLLFIWRKFGPLYCLLSSFLISVTIYVSIQLFNNSFAVDINQDLDGVCPYIILFVLGMLSAYISFDNKTFKIRSVVPWLLLSFLLLVVNYFFINLECITTLHHPFLVNDVTFGLISCCFLIGLSGKKGFFLQKILAYKPLVFTGNFAYSIYLIHAPLIQVIWQYIIRPFNLSTLSAYYTLAIIGLPTIIAISYLFYLAFERPFTSHKRLIAV